MPQSLVLNAKISYHYHKKIYIDYVELADFLQEIFKKEEFGLLEDALLSTAKALKKKYKSIKKVSLHLIKPEISPPARFGVHYKRIFKL